MLLLGTGVTTLKLLLFVAAGGKARPVLMAAIHEAMAAAFSTTFMVAAILLTLTLVPAFFLPRKHEESHLLDDATADDVAPAVLLH